MTTVAPAVRKLVAQEATERPVPQGVAALARAVVERFPCSVRAILFYGSCRRDGSVAGLVDFYVIVDAYAGLRWWERWLARLLPPNVYYLELDLPDTPLRAKCTLISMRAFTRGVSRWHHPYLWARFAQPVTLAYCAEGGAAEVVDCLAGAVDRFVRLSQPLVGDTFTARELWCAGLRKSFAAEIRSEHPDRIAALFDAHRSYYERSTLNVLGAGALQHDHGMSFANTTGPNTRRLGRLAWRGRIVVGKLLSLARILKSALTFQGGLDYVVWKLERHSGRKIAVPERVRRHPMIYLWPFFWRLYRQGVFR